MAFSNRCLVFEHVPKCGGMTLHHLLQRSFEKERTYVCLQQAKACLAAFRALPAADRERYGLVAGHGVYTLVREDFIPRPVFCFTMLRDPAERFVSLYHYLRRKEQNVAHEAAHGVDLVSFAESAYGRSRACSLTRRFAEMTYEEVQARPEEAVASALANLERDFDLVGLLERYDETLFLLWQAMGRHLPPLYARRNTARSKTALTDEERAAVEEVSVLDRAVYNAVRATFDQKVAARGLLMATSVQAYGVANGLFNRARALVR